MTRRTLLLLLRAVALAAAIVAVHVLLVQPAWKKAAAEAARETSLAADCRNVQSGWANLVTDLSRRHPEVGAPAGLTDAVVARLLAAEPAPPAAGLPRLTEAVPRFLQETARLAATYDIAWPAIRADRPEPAAVNLADGGTIPLSRIRVHLAGSGSYASLGRALHDLLGGETGAVIRDISIRSGHHGTVVAELELDLYGAP
jgi:hypothetical protein